MANKVDIAQSSEDLMKDVDKDRFKVSSVKCQDSHVDSGDSDSDIDPLALDHLWGTLTKEVMDEDREIDCVLSTCHKIRKNKKLNEKPARR